MKKKYLTLFSSVALLTLIGCSGHIETASAEEKANPEYIPAAPVVPTSVRANADSLSLAVNDTYQLVNRIRPIEAYDSAFEYVSSNESAVTVSETGLITAVAVGYSEVTVRSVAVPTVKRVIPVNVTSSVKSSQTGSAISKQFTAQRASFFDYDTRKYHNPDEVKQEMNYVSKKIVNGVDHEVFKVYRDIIISESNAYFFMNSDTEYTNYEEGAKHFSNSRYDVIARQGRYDAYILSSSVDSGKKNYYYANTGFIADEIDEEGNKYPLVEVNFRILDSLFSSGRELATDVTKRALSTAKLSISELTGIRGNSDYSVLTGRFNIYNKDSFKIATDQEESFQIPALTPVTMTYYYDLTWVNGIVRTYDIVQTIDYELDGKTISESVVINYTLHANYTPINGGDRVTEFSYEIPDKDAEKYKEVKDIYDL